MNANEYLTIKIRLINLFLSQMIKEILDISYEYEGKYLKLQIVLLKGSDSYSIERSVKNFFEGFIIDVEFVYLTKEEFNSNIGNWLPEKYKWLPHILYSKAEIL